MQYQSSCAPKLARKCEIEHWLPCGADGREGGVRSRDYQIFWVDLLTHGAPQARLARQSSAILCTVHGIETNSPFPHTPTDVIPNFSNDNISHRPIDGHPAEHSGEGLRRRERESILLGRA